MMVMVFCVEVPFGGLRGCVIVIIEGCAFMGVGGGDGFGSGWLIC